MRVIPRDCGGPKLADAWSMSALVFVVLFGTLARMFVDDDRGQA